MLYSKLEFVFPFPPSDFTFNEENGYEQVSFQVADALKQPFPDGQFDLVWSMESGEHMPDKTKVMLCVCMSKRCLVLVGACMRRLSCDLVLCSLIFCLFQILCL